MLTDHITRLAAGVAIVGITLGWTAVAAEDVSFNEQIRPLLSSRCFACHGPDEESREAGLRLDRGDGDDGALVVAIVPGSVDESEVWARITSEDPDVVMPPPDSHLKPLSTDEQALVRRWIESGAPYDNFWAYQAPKSPAIPTISDETFAQWGQTGGASTIRSVDAFVLDKLRLNSLRPSEQADPRTLIRRLSFDLTGLPPTLNEVHDFVSSYPSSPDSVWEATINRLLASPRYGEHMARYWLDLVRFADTNGMHKDFYRHHSPYRDWVIRSFNDNLRYDDFVRYQMAGDLFEDPSRDQLIASGFHRLHLIIDAGTALPEESNFKNVVDRITSVGTAFMGLTIQCAQCHDHKFDPITQKDFFSLYAFLDNDEAQAETRGKEPGGIQQPSIRLSTEDQERRLAELEQDIKQWESQRPDEASEGFKAWQQQLAILGKQRDEFLQGIPQAMVMKERGEVRPTFVRIRGQYDAIGEAVSRNTPSFLPTLEKADEIATRLDLANWLVDRRNPLTARVAVNRFWQQFFGVGLVKTSEDFGSQGDVPSHPLLLDYLTVSFIESGWDIKRLMKQIAMSTTYRQSAEASADDYRRFPENRLLARGPRFRLDAEMIRDQILLTSGLLSDEMFGDSVKPPQPDGLWEAVSMTGEVFRPDSGDDIHRRSVYTFWKRAMPPPQMTIFNAPIRDACTARRERTNTPLQALLMLNESQSMFASRQLAAKILEQPDEERFVFAWETVTARLPDAQETSTMKLLVDDLRAQYLADPQLAEAICDGLALDSVTAKADLAAWTLLASTLYNLDITKTKN